MPTKGSSQPAPVHPKPVTLTFDKVDQQLQELDPQLYDLLRALHARPANAEVAVRRFIAGHPSLFPDDGPDGQNTRDVLDPEGRLLQSWNALDVGDPQRDAIEPYFNSLDRLTDVCVAMNGLLSDSDTPTNRRRLREALVAEIESYLVGRRWNDLPGEKPLPPSPQPLTEAHQAAFDLICTAGPLTGKEIVNRLALTSESLFTGKYVPRLKEHGILNRPGLGYYHPDFYKPGPKPVGER
jgi:hypothetical protein